MHEDTLFLAIDKNELDEVKEIVKKGQTNLNYIQEGDPLLVYALYKGHVRVARILLEAGADPNIGNDGSVRSKFRTRTPLNFSVQWEMSPKVVKDLVPEDQKAVPGLVRYMLKKGAKANNLTPVGTSALQQLLFYWEEDNPKELKACRKVFRDLVTHGAMEGSVLSPFLKKRFRSEFSLLQKKALKKKDYKASDPKEIERQIQKAIQNQNLLELSLRLLFLKEGINTRLEYGCSPLFYAIDENLPNVVEFLILQGAAIEQHERKLTPLFTAAEKGQVNIVELLLKYGSNITGEFDFNSEEALSIAAFKFCDALIRLLRDKTALDAAVVGEDFLDRHSEIDEYWNLIFTTLNCSPWVAFGEREDLRRDFTFSCLALYRVYLNHLRYQQLNAVQQKTLHTIENFKIIYHLILQKIEILNEKAPSDELDAEATEDEEEAGAYHLDLSCPFQQQPSLTRQQAEECLDRLNQELLSKDESKIDWKQYPNLWIAQYRGLHYYRDSFSKKKRADHRRTFHLNRLAPAPAVYAMSALMPVQHQLARESRLSENKETVVKIFEQFESSKPVKQYWSPKEKTFENESDMLQQRMSMSYGSYKKDILDKKDKTTAILHDQKIIGYPHYATSDLPFHALKYAYGQKKIEGLTQWRLRPLFQEDGSRLHPYPGKIFISLYTPLQLYNYKARHVAGMHKRQKIALGSTILPERETSIPGGIDSDAAFYEELLVIPEFRIFDEAYEEKYGIKATFFKEIQSKIARSWTDPDLESRNKIRKKVKNDLIEKVLIIHKEKELLRIAQEEARRRGGFLIYRHSAGVYGLEPEPLPIPRDPQNANLYKREKKLFAALGEQRFNPGSELDISTDDNANEDTSDFSENDSSSDFFGSSASHNTPVDLARLSSMGLEYQAVPGDGHCLYHAVALYLGKAQNILRTEVADYLENHKADYAAFMADKNIDDYIRDIRGGIEWADNIEIEILMRIFSRPIIIIDPHLSIRNQGAIQRAGDPILVYYNGVDHYDALLNPNDLTSEDIQRLLNPEPQTNNPGSKNPKKRHASDSLNEEWPPLKKGASALPINKEKSDLADFLEDIEMSPPLYLPGSCSLHTARKRKKEEDKNEEPVRSLADNTELLKPSEKKIKL